MGNNEMIVDKFDINSKVKLGTKRGYPLGYIILNEPNLIKWAFVNGKLDKKFKGEVDSHYEKYHEKGDISKVSNISLTYSEYVIINKKEIERIESILNSYIQSNSDLDLVETNNTRLLTVKIRNNMWLRFEIICVEDALLIKFTKEYHRLKRGKDVGEGVISTKTTTRLQPTNIIMCNAPADKQLEMCLQIEPKPIWINKISDISEIYFDRIAWSKSQ